MSFTSPQGYNTTWKVVRQKSPARRRPAPAVISGHCRSACARSRLAPLSPASLPRNSVAPPHSAPIRCGSSHSCRFAALPRPPVSRARTQGTTTAPLELPGNARCPEVRLKWPQPGLPKPTNHRPPGAREDFSGLSKADSESIDCQASRSMLASAASMARSACNPSSSEQIGAARPSTASRN
jgi:hypothetical protein